MSTPKKPTDARSTLGYGCPPKQSQFKKGCSGNPAGRPKGSKSTKSLLLAALNEKVTINENGLSKMVSKREAAAKQMANKIAMGDLSAFKVVTQILANSEEREEDKINAHNGHSARERIIKKIEEISKRMRAGQGLPPDED